MGCINTARCLHLLAANETLGEAEFNIRRGGVNDPEAITKMHMKRNAAGGEVIFPKNGGPFSGNACAVYDWLPGDWAEFDNVDIVNDPTLSVENAIYIGGCFEQSAQILLPTRSLSGILWA